MLKKNNKAILDILHTLENHKYMHSHIEGHRANAG